MDWTSFYLGTAGAAATLMGLLFIGVQFRLGAFTDEPVSRWRFIARSTFTMYVLLFILPMSFLIPNLGNTNHALFIFIVVLYCAVRAVTTWLPVWRSIRGRGERASETTWLLIGPLAAYFSLAYFGFRLYAGANADAMQTSIAMILIAFFSIVLRNSWNLLVELPNEKHQNHS
jgi:hypothetical protein